MGALVDVCSRPELSFGRLAELGELRQRWLEWEAEKGRPLLAELALRAALELDQCWLAGQLESDRCWQV